MGTPRRPRPQLARINAMRNSSYSAEGEDGDDDLVAYGELLRKLGLSSTDDFTIPPAVYAAAMSHLPNAARRRASLEKQEQTPAARPEASSSSPPENPQVSGPGVVVVAARMERAGEGDDGKLVQSETMQVNARNHQGPRAESSRKLVELEIVETSTRAITRASKPENAVQDKEDDKIAKVDALREERRRGVVVEATRETTSALPLVVAAESTSLDIERLFSPSPNRRFRRTITSWVKGGHIGSGSFGSVYEAMSDDGFFFAVKEVSLIDQGINAKQRIIQLEHEVSLLSRLEHDNIVQYYGTDKEDGKLYIFLELVSQGSLAALYQRYCLQDSQVSAYTRQILNGLNYLHQRNVLHRDIKCANILVDANGSVKLADFGLAKEMSILSQARSSKGTVFWMAPEVAKAKPHGPPADIWSLGCTVLEMLTCKVPYPDMEWTHALLKIGRGIPPKIPDKLSEDARDFIAKCVQANPKDRPSAAQLFDHPFVQRPLQH
ncbi:mitogen-activated protein kinase kinase kinase 1 isoform X2 [Brachypodium distachyon]|uniref:mitogen-activated protein kinase kinase kinase 1 isoform X2 n=1 Tax=Brachypodium distachyon TaxID=15368 RepID=UPI000D0D6209|nr:mitogen-activated protein kinase kinase kinase 1 isoform X2 [Brachypodium distachyon]|eukprot:XP_024316995.1 mitogen-activated protein kinase kinase kinase 1 isoform X2 [Brachypodium distachyon]